MNLNNIGNWISRRAAILPDKLALRQDGRGLTYAQLSERIDRLANALLAMGLLRGDRVAFLGRNSMENLEVCFACARVGLITVPLNWRLAAPEIAFILDNTGASALIWEPCFDEVVGTLVQNGQAPALRVVLGEQPTAVAEAAYEALLAAASPAEPPGVDEVSLDDPHLIMVTAGTTGQPKGVVLTHRNTTTQCLNALQLGLTPDVVGLAVLPFFHVGGLHGSAIPVLFIGGTLVIQAAFDPGETLRIIAQERVQGMVGVPAMFLFMAQHADFASADLSSVSVFTSGGAPLPVSLIETYEKRGVRFRQGYGLTECSAGVTGMDPADAYRKPGSAGRACFYTEVAVVDPETGTPVPAGSLGEVVVRGDNVMSGYWNQPEETAATIREGWLWTGDIGRLDDEGFLYLVDRRKQMIISGGENIFPAELENALYRHPAVKECAVFGVPDARFGERPSAVVVPHAGMQPSEDELRAHLAGLLARFKLPRDIHVRQAPLPRNAAGKVVHADLKAELQG